MKMSMKLKRRKMLVMVEVTLHWAVFPTTRHTSTTLYDGDSLSCRFVRALIQICCGTQLFPAFYIAKCMLVR